MQYGIFLGGNCKHSAGLIYYVNIHRDESKTDESCSFIEPSNCAKKLYPRGEELENIEDIPDKYKIPAMNFDMITDAAKEKHYKLMLNAGNSESPLFKLCKMRLPSTSETNIPTLPHWIKQFVFRETTEEDFPDRVIS